MRIAIFGSWKGYKKRDWKLKYSPKEFRTACFDIGFKLAEHGHSVIVGSQSPNTADRHVVQGLANYVQEHSKDGKVDSPLVEIIRPKDTHSPFSECSEDLLEVLRRHETEEDDWHAAHLSAVEMADAVLIVGGVEASYVAGLIAIGGRKTLVPIGSFGGAGHKLLDRVLRESDIQSKQEYQQLYERWSPRLLPVALDLLRVFNYPEASRVLYDLFLSFSSEDRQEANQVAEQAQELKLRCFLFEKLRYGDIWPEEIRRAILSSREMCVLMTEQALRSEWVITEWGAAWVLGKRITPILVDLKPSELPDRLRRFQAVDFEHVMRYLEQVKHRASVDVT